MQNYWFLILKDGEQIRVKPDNVERVKTSMADGSVIDTPTRMIPINEIRSFFESDVVYTGDQKLLEDVARAFNTPMSTDNGIQVEWVKKKVPTRKWNSHYSSIPAYRHLAEDSSYVTMAFRLPTHQIDYALVEACTVDELKKLAPSQNQARKD